MNCWSQYLSWPPPLGLLLLIGRRNSTAEPISKLRKLAVFHGFYSHDFFYRREPKLMWLLGECGCCVCSSWHSPTYILCFIMELLTGAYEIGTLTFWAMRHWGTRSLKCWLCWHFGRGEHARLSFQHAHVCTPWCMCFGGAAALQCSKGVRDGVLYKISLPNRKH